MQQIASGLYVPDTVAYQDQGAEASLTRQYDGMAKLEKHFPRLVRLALELAASLTALAGRRGLGAQAVMLDAPRWHPSGSIVVRVGLDETAPRIQTTDKAVGNFVTLAEVNRDIPQVVDLAMAIAYQLVPAVNARKILPAEVEFSKPKFKADDSAFIFTVSVKGKGMALPSQVAL